MWCKRIDTGSAAERNDECVGRAGRIVVGYSGVPCKANYDSDLIDLLTELRHWCDAENVDYNAADQQAQKCHSEEVEGLDAT